MKTRNDSLMPDGVPRYIRCYDLGEQTGDRYTVVFTKKRDCGQFLHVGMSANPFHPQGIGQHGATAELIDTNEHGWPPAMGRKNHLGKRISFKDLPADCQKLVSGDYVALWEL